MFDLRALDWDVGTLADHSPDGARLFNNADPEDALPVPSADETYAFSFTGTAANSKAEFSIKVQDAAAGAAPWGVRSRCHQLISRLWAAALYCFYSVSGFGAL